MGTTWPITTCIKTSRAFSNGFHGSRQFRGPSWGYWNLNEVHHFDPFFSSFDFALDILTRRILCSIIPNTESRLAHFHTVTILSSRWTCSPRNKRWVTVQSLIESAAKMRTACRNGSISNNVHNAFWADWGLWVNIEYRVERGLSVLACRSRCLDLYNFVVEAVNAVLEVQVTDATNAGFRPTT